MRVRLLVASDRDAGAVTVTARVPVTSDSLSVTREARPPVPAARGRRHSEARAARTSTAVARILPRQGQSGVSP